MNNALSKFTGCRDLGQVGATRVTNPSKRETTSLRLTLKSNLRYKREVCQGIMRSLKTLLDNPKLSLQQKLCTQTQSERLPYSIASHSLIMFTKTIPNSTNQIKC